MPPAVDLARRYAEALAALRAVHVFDAWLGDFWQERCPAPPSAPAAQTTVGAAGAIAWFESMDTVVGYLPGEDGCFRIPRDIAMPDFPSAATGQALPFGKDIVISAAMREEIQPPGS